MTPEEIKELLRKGKRKGTKKRRNSVGIKPTHQEQLEELFNGSQLSSQVPSQSGSFSSVPGIKVHNFGASRFGQSSVGNPLHRALHGLPPVQVPVQRQDQVSEMLQCMPSAMHDVQHSVLGLEDKTDQLLELLKSLAPIVEETNEVVKGSDENLKDLSKKVSTGLDKLGKSINSIRSEKPDGINKILYCFCAYYKILFAVTRLALEFIWLLSQSGYQWASALPFWGLCIPHIIITYFSYLMYSIVFQGGVYLLTPYPVNYLVDLYPLVFNENMALQLMSLQAGNLIRSAGLGLWRVRSLTEPTDRALRSITAGVLGINNQSSVGSVLLSYVRVPFNFVSRNIVQRVIDGVRSNLPSIEVGAGISSVGSGLSGAASAVGSGLSGAASAVGSGLSGAASTVSEYLPEMSSLPGMSSLPSMPSLPGMASLPGFPWRGTGGAVLNNNLRYNEVIPLKNKAFDLTMFDKELDEITFLTKTERELFNSSKSGKIFNKLSIKLDNILTKQLNVLVKNDSLRVSIYLVILEKCVNFIEVNIPTFKSGFNASLKPYALVLKHDIQLINHKVLFPELLNTDPISPIYPQLNIQKNTNLNPAHMNRYLKSATRRNLRKKIL
jgi:hypothetical protein